GSDGLARLAASPADRERRPRSRYQRGLLRAAKLLQDGFERVDDFIPRGAALGERQLQVEGLGRRPVGKDVVLGTTRLRLGGFLPELLAGGASLARDLL